MQRRGCGLVHDDTKKCENALGGDMVNMSKVKSLRDGDVSVHVPLKLDWVQNGRSDWLPGQRSRRRGQTKQQPTVPLAINGTRASVCVRRRAIHCRPFLCYLTLLQLLHQCQNHLQSLKVLCETLSDLLHILVSIARATSQEDDRVPIGKLPLVHLFVLKCSLLHSSPPTTPYLGIDQTQTQW